MGFPSCGPCNTGVTVAVDSLGRIVKKLEGEGGEVETVQGAIIAAVPSYTYATLYTFWGDRCILFIAILAVGSGCWIRYKRA